MSQRLRLVLEHMPDEQLMQKLEKTRGHGRDDDPVRAMWNALLAGIVFQHDSDAKLLRELSRNGQLRQLCGFKGKAPTASAFSRFVKRVLDELPDVVAIFDQLVQHASALLPDFGKRLAMDSKAIESFASGRNKNKRADGRRDLDANDGKKVCRGTKEDGTQWQKVRTWFGYKLHLVVDAVYELPVMYAVTKASEPDINEGHRLLEQMERRQPGILEEAEVLTADRGYDDTKLITKCWDTYKIKPVIDIRNMWQDKEETRVLRDLENVTYNHKGQVYCYCPVTGKVREMTCGGFEKDRDTLKKLCPAKQYGITCKGQGLCPVARGIRIPLSENRRIFTPIDRASDKWQREYRKRTSVERVNSRLDVSFGFEQHTIRGMRKMQTKCGLALCIMLAMAVGRIKEKQQEKMRSLISAA